MWIVVVLSFVMFGLAIVSVLSVTFLFWVTILFVTVLFVAVSFYIWITSLICKTLITFYFGVLLLIWVIILLVIVWRCPIFLCFLTVSFIRLNRVPFRFGPLTFISCIGVIFLGTNTDVAVLPLILALCCITPWSTFTLSGRISTVIVVTYNNRKWPLFI